MSDVADEFDDCHFVTDEDFSKYSFKAKETPWKSLSGPHNIRLLKIFSKKESTAFGDETIECTLEEWDLHKASGKYEALSYAWGEPDNGFAFIQCGNVTTKIWRNLHQALLRLREKISGGKTRKTRLIWVDALCIDQTKDGLSERQEQILLMKHIFGYASQVLIWLGEHDKFSQAVWKSVEGVQPGSPMELIRNAIQWNIKLHDGFVRRAWFRRVWTLQEVVLSSKATLLCGGDEMDWITFCTIWKERYEFMKNLKPEIRDSRVDHIEESLDFIGLMNCFDIHQTRFSNIDPSLKTLPLSEIIIRTWYRDATEAHDRIYAILGMVKAGNYAGLEKPNYSQPALELFINVIKTAMLTDGMPALLNIAGLSPEDMAPRANRPRPAQWLISVTRQSRQMDFTPLTDRPSWVPDWSKHGWENNWLTMQLASDDSAARLKPGAGKYIFEPRTWQPVFEGNKLTIRGHIVGHLSQANILRHLRTGRNNSSSFIAEGLSYGTTGQIRWAGSSLHEGREYTVPYSTLPYGGDTAMPGDVICAFEGIRSLFLVRMMFQFNFGTPGALEWLKEDVQAGTRLNCLLMGPVQVDGIELLENPSLGNGYWEFIIN